MQKRRAASQLVLDAKNLIPPDVIAQSWTALLGTSLMGVAICDRQLRYTAVNEALALMDGVQIEDHLGRPVSKILGSAAKRVENAIREVLSTGRPVYNLKLTAQLPNRKELGHWLENYYPVKGSHNQTTYVVVVVIEVTQRHKLEKSVRRLTDLLIQANGIVKTNKSPTSNGTFASKHQRRTPASLEELLERCLVEINRVTDLVGPALRLTADLQEGLSQLLVSPGNVPAATGGSLMKQNTLRVGLLTAREREVLLLLAEGKSSKEIGEVLRISSRTVDIHRARIMQKLELHSVGELVRFAVRNQVVPA